MWNPKSSVLYPSYNPKASQLQSAGLTNPYLQMHKCLEIERYIINAARWKQTVSGLSKPLLIQFDKTLVMQRIASLIPIS